MTQAMADLARQTLCVLVSACLVLGRMISRRTIMAPAVLAMLAMGTVAGLAQTAPTVTGGPADQTVGVGATAIFSASAVGSPTPTVQWQSSTDGGASYSNITGATATSYTTPAATAADNGKRFRAVFANSQGDATTNAAALTVVQAPVANNQSVTTAFNTATAITLLASDPNSPPRSLTYTVTTSPTHGTLSGTAPNLMYTPTTGYNGSDSFTFTASNGFSTSNSATVSITVSPAQPQATSVSPSQGPTAGGTGITVFGTGFTQTGTTVTVGGSPASNVMVVSNTQLRATTPAGNAGTVNVAVTTAGGTSTQTGGSLFTYIAPPVANAQSVTTAYNTATAITLSASNTPTSYAVTTAPTHGTLTGTAPNLTYTPTPGYGGPDSFAFTASNAGGTSSPATVSITVSPPIITVAPPTLPSGTAGTAYSATLSASGGTASYSFAITAGALPAGLTLATNGTLSGTPTQSGSFTFTATARDSSTGTGPYTASRSYTLAIADPTIVVAPASLPNAMVGTAYSQTLTALGGSGTYTYTITAGALPAGLTLSTSGSLGGTPTAGGSFSFTATATDSGGFSGNRAYTLTVTAPTVAIAPATLPAGTTGVAYSQTLTASGGTAPYSYAITAGALPAGLTLSSTGTVSGTPTASGSTTFTVTATDASTGSGPYRGTRSYTLTIADPTITLAPATLPPATVGAAYSQTITASGGSGTYGYAITAGALPAGLTLSAGGTLSGTPTAGGSFSFTVSATDANGNPGSRNYTLTVAAPTIAVAPASLPAGTAGTAYSQTLTASGGTAPYSFAVTTGALPAGITLSSTGTLSGTPTASGSTTITVTATDASTGSGPFRGTRSYTLTIAAPTITLAPATLPGATVGTAYSQAITASGGTAPYAYTITGGALPNGLTLSQAGTLSGTPTGGGTFTFTVTATDAGNNAGTRSYSLAVGIPAAPTAPVAATTTVLTASPNPSQSGQTVTLTATVTSPGGTPTGTVTFTNSGMTLGTSTLTNGTATIAVATLPVGTSTLTASYGGTSAFAESSGTATQTVAAAGTTTALTASPNPSLSGQAVTLTATVTSPGGTPTGTVTFSNGGTSLGSATLSNGTATLATAALPVGTNALTASYAGAAGFTASTGSASQTVTAAATTTALTATPNPSTFGQAVTFTVTVSGGLNPTGTVSFRDGGTVLGPAALANGTASFSTAALATGTHGITAVYGGDAGNGASTSAVLTQVVNAAATTTVLASSQNPSAVGQTVRFTATVSGAGGTPGGSVTFRDGATILGTAVLAGGTASLATADLTAGPHTITAAYVGDASYAASTSAGLAQTVNAVAGGMTLTISSTGRDGSFSFGSTLPGAAAFTLTSTGNRISRSFEGVPAGTYSITSLGLPTGFVLQGFTCSSGISGSNSVTFTVAAGTRVSCSFNAGFDEEGVRRTTQAAIRSFLQQRAEAVAQAQPDSRRFHDRFTGAMFGGDGATGLVPSYGANPVEFTGSTVLGGTNITATTSLSRFLRPEEKLEFDAWAEVRSGSYRDSFDTNPLTAGVIGPRSRTSGNFTLGFVGLDYRVQPGVLLGVLGQYDQVSQDSAALGTRASGTGFMVGPYLSMALTPGLFLDARTAYGTSSNQITPSGLLQSSFSTDRQLYRAELSGLYRLGDLAMLPSISAIYFSENQHAFTDALGVRIPGQRVGLGQLAVGPEFAYDIPLGRNLLVPRVSVKAIYNFLRDDAASAELGIVQPTGPLRARVEGGLDLQDYYGFTMGASIAYDGIGDTHYSATSGRLSVRRPF